MALLFPFLGASCAMTGVTTGSLKLERADPDWAQVLGNTIVLHARHALPDTTVTCEVGISNRHEWIADDYSRVVIVTFTSPGGGYTSRYVLSPWQHLAWRGLASKRPELITVNRHAIVFGSEIEGDGAERVRTIHERSRAIVVDLVGAEFCNRGTQLGDWSVAAQKAPDTENLAFAPIYRLKPYFLQVDCFVPEPGQPCTGPESWGSVVQDRVLIAMGHGPGLAFRIDCFPPDSVDRSRPRPFDPSEQMLAPGTDLKGARERMEQALCSIFDRAVKRALDADGDDERLRAKIIEDALPALEQAVFAFPAHSGPAHAAGAAALGLWHERLSDLLLNEEFWSHDKGHWPENLLSYDITLIEELRRLPVARANQFQSLLAAFHRYHQLAVKLAGTAAAELGSFTPSTEALLCAELGDRVRTVLARDPSAKGDLRVSSYTGYRFGVSHPLEGSRVHQAYGPISVPLPTR